MRVNQCPHVAVSAKSQDANAGDNIVPCKHFLAGTTNKSKEDCPYCRIESLEATAPQWHDAPTCSGLWFCDEGDKNPYRFTCHNVSIPLNPHLVGEGERWYGPIPPDGDKP